MFDIGFYGGKMLPVHLGHIFCIEQAALQCHQLHVILFHSSETEKSLVAYSSLHKKILSPEIREFVLRETFKREKKIFIHSINAQQCVSSEDILKKKKFSDVEFVSKILKKNPNAIFSSEPSYSNFFSQLYPHAQQIIIDAERKNFPISGTLLRNLSFKEAKKFLPQAYNLFF